MPHKAPSRSVGQNIRAEAARRRVNMVKLSAATGIPRTTLIGQIDTGRVTVDTLMAISKALEVPLSDLLGEAVA
jgi:DNA-binding Xre family transcriptional regulator